MIDQPRQVAAGMPALSGGGSLPPGAYRQLVAPVHAALRASDLDKRPFQLAAMIVEASLARGRQYVHVLNARQLGELYRFTASDIADILNGRINVSGPVVGLIKANILRRLELPLDKGWLLVVNPDWSQWVVPMLHSPAGKARWLGIVDGQARELQRQLVADEIEWHFPDLTALLSNVDVENALRLLQDGKSYVGAQSMVGTQDGPRPLAGLPVRAEVAGDALVGRNETMRSGVARPSCGVAAVDHEDALDVPKRNGPRADVARRSEFPNAKWPEKTREFGNSEPSHQRPVKQKVEQKTVQQFNRFNRDDSNRLLAELKAEFVRAHGQAEADAEMVRSGGFWRRVARAWPSLMEREIGALRNHISEGGGFSPKAWFYIAFYMLKSLGETNWTAALKKSKESFK